MCAVVTAPLACRNLSLATLMFMCAVVTAPLACRNLRLATLTFMCAWSQHLGLPEFELGYANVHVRCGHSTFGLPEFAPFDAILVAAAAPRYCWLFGTEPDRYSVSMRSLSWRRRTLKTISSPGFSLETTLR